MADRPYEADGNVYVEARSRTNIRGPREPGDRFYVDPDVLEVQRPHILPVEELEADEATAADTVEVAFGDGEAEALTPEQLAERWAEEYNLRPDEYIDRYDEDAAGSDAALALMDLEVEVPEADDEDEDEADADAEADEDAQEDEEEGEGE